MLAPEQVIPFLSHDDALVRNHAIRYFEYAHDVAPLTADAVWDAIDRLDPSESAARLLQLLPRVPQSDSSTDRLLAAFAEERHLDVEEDLWDVVFDLDFEQLHRHRTRILALKDLPDDVAERLSARLELAEVPVESLWDRLLAHIDETRDKYWDEIDHAEGNHLIEALARHGDPIAARAIALLENSVIVGPDADNAENIYAAKLLGRLRHRPALDLLVQKFIECDEEADVLHETLTEAIPKVGGADAVAPIAAEYPRPGQAYGIYAADLLGRIKHPTAEAALLRLIEDPATDKFRSELGYALGALCPTDGFPALKQLVLAGNYDPQFAELQEDLVACALMIGADFPELGPLREEVIAREIEDERRLEAIASGMLDGNPDADFEDDAFFDDDRGADLPALPSQLDDRYPPATLPITRAAPKVGRNDPCPCGSGKKYKKCCLDKSA